VRLLREAFINDQPNLDPRRLVFIDESGMRLGLTTRYGWATRGKKAYGTASHSPWRTVTMIGAIGLDGFRGFVNIEAATSSEVFRAFVLCMLVPNLRAGDCVVMDNLSAHKDKQAVEAIEKTGATVMYLPPYSPEFNPIEKVWSKLKDYVRRLATDTREQFDEAVADAMAAVTSSNIQGWFSHCGYQIT